MSRYKDSTELFLNNFQKFKNKFDCLKNNLSKKYVAVIFLSIETIDRI